MRQRRREESTDFMLPINNKSFCINILNKTQNRLKGCIYGQAIGDALGLGTEFMNREEVCRLTHYDPRCVGSCVIVTKIIQRLIFQDEIMSKEEMIKIAKNYDKRIVDAIENSFCEDLSELDLCGRDMGYTLKTFSVALWCLWHATDFKDGLLKVVNQGGDADTNGATACAVLGAKFGFSDIPEYYCIELHDNHIIEGIYQDALNDLI